MDVQVPIYLYDVVTAVVPPRLIVTLRSVDEAQTLAAHLNGLRRAGQIDDETFTVARARTASMMVTVDPGATVRIGGYTVDVGRLGVAP